MTEERKDLLAETVLDSLENYKLLELVLDNLGVAVLVVNASGEIILINKEAEFLFGYHRDELKGQTVEILIPEEVRDKHPQLRDMYSREPRTRPMGEGLNLETVTKDKRHIPVFISLGSFMTPKGIHITTTIIKK